MFFFLGVLALGFMIYKIGLQTIWDNVRQLKWWFLVVLLLWGFVYVINAISFHTIIRDGSPESKKIRFLRTLKLTISGYAINTLTPFGLLGGEPYKVIELEPVLGVQKATSSVLLYAMMHFVSHFIFWMVSIPLLLFIVPVISLTLKLILSAAAVASMLLLYWSFTVYTRGFVSRGLSLISKLPFLGKKVRRYKAKNMEKIEQMDELIADLYKNRKKDFVWSLSLELVARYILCFEVILFLSPIGVVIPYSKSIVIESIQSMVGNLFFFMPLQLGAREGGFVLAFGILSIPVANGVFLSLCKRVREFFWTLIGLGLIKIKPAK